MPSAKPSAEQDLASQLAQAVELHKQGALQEAASMYSELLRAEPQQAEASFYLGSLYLQQNKLNPALQLLQRCVRLEPGWPLAWLNLGLVYQSLNQPKHAAQAFKRVLDLWPEHAQAWNNLGVIQKNAGQMQQALEYFSKAVQADPHNHEAWNNLGLMLQAKDRSREAITAYQNALNLNPDYTQAYKNLAQALEHIGDAEDALQCYQQANELDPQDKDTLRQWSELLKRQGKLEEAARLQQSILELDPRDVLAFVQLGIVRTEQGLIHAALKNYQQALRLNPASATAHSNMLLVTNYFPDSDALQLMQAHRDWDRMHGSGKHVPASSWRVRTDPEKRLRVGFVSPDFRKHPVAYFFLTLLQGLDPAQIEAICYFNHTRKDEMTWKIKEHAHIWRDAAHISDENLAQVIHNDQVDILVDLAGHTGRHRLQVFARKPAPVQVTWLGYPNTTGLEAMDFRLTDSIADPEGHADRLSSERIIRMPRGFHCFAKPEDAPDVAPTPALDNGYITFGSFNNLAKINKQVVALWSKILRKLPGSRLVLKSRSLEDPEAKSRYRDLFAEHKIDPERVDILDRVPSFAGHLQTYSRVDIGLDPFPYNGTTTTCDALYMGVPVLTLLGDRHCGRVGASLLSLIGRQQWIGKNKKQYIELAQDLARDPHKLQEIRQGLRQELQQSPLGDMAGFGRDMQDTLRSIWREWCARQNP